MKMNNEGSYFTPNDNSINDTVKVLEDILKDLGEGNKVTIGIDCNANNFYSDQAKKYEMDGFKQPIENDQLIDFYLKYCSEHPLITYLEDPISELDHQGWKKIISKFEEKPSIQIVGKNIFNDSASLLRDVNYYVFILN
jgi:enolase